MTNAQIEGKEGKKLLKTQWYKKVEEEYAHLMPDQENLDPSWGFDGEGQIMDKNENNKKQV